MTRRGLIIALSIAALAGLLFGVFPQLDLAATRAFYRAGRFVLSGDRIADIARDAAMLVVAALVAPAIAAAVLKLIWPRGRMRVPGRAAVLLIATLILGPGLMANIGFKDNWGRPRPRDLVEFGGRAQFHPWWDPRGGCPNNCSFVAGEAAGAFWTLAPASLAPPQWRGLAYAGALGFGAAVGLLRVSVGGHFVSDVVFAGVFTFLIVWLVHGVLYRWPTGISDAAVEHAFEAVGSAPRRALAALLGRFRPLPASEAEQGRSRPVD